MRHHPLIYAALLRASVRPRAGPGVGRRRDDPGGRRQRPRQGRSPDPGGGLLGSFVRAFAPIDIDCDGNDDDPKVRALYLSLDRGGDGARGTVWDDRKEIRAHRAGKLLEMTIREEDGDKVELTMPWSLARCVLGGEDLTRKEIDRAMETGEFSIHVQDEDSNVHISID